MQMREWIKVANENYLHAQWYRHRSHCSLWVVFDAHLCGTKMGAKFLLLLYENGSELGALWEDQQKKSRR